MTKLDNETRKKKHKFIASTRIFLLPTVKQWLQFLCSPGCCMSLSCVVKVSCDYPVWGHSLLIPLGFISGLLRQPHKSDYMFNSRKKK